MNYHDDEYDGVVLKIPSWFIKMNKLEEGDIKTEAKP